MGTKNGRGGNGMPHRISLSQLADGAVAERFEQELQKVLDNILDPNTEAKKTRKLTLTMTFKTDDHREITNVDIEAKTTLAPAHAISTKFLMDRDSRGNAVGAEFAQTKLSLDDAQPEVAASEEKVSYIERKQAGRV